MLEMSVCFLGFDTKTFLKISSFTRRLNVSRIYMSLSLLCVSETVVNDEEYEKGMSSAYMTYVVCERNDPPELIPLDSQCHRMPTKEILQTDSVSLHEHNG